MSSLTNYQAGQEFPPIAETMLSKIAADLNPQATSLVGGPPPTPAVLEAIVDAIAAISTSLGF